MNIDMLWGDNVGEESTKTWKDKITSGFFEKYMSGKGLDIGYSGYKQNTHPILPEAIGVDTTYPGYDGKTLPFESGSLDYCYSSHCLEHISDYKNAIREQFRVIKSGGYIIIVVPHQDLYEKKESLPSRYNEDHKRMYQSHTLLTEIFESLPRNSYRIRHLQENDQNHDYSQPAEEHSKGQYEIECVIEKLK